MCDPLTIAGIAATVGSTVVNTVANSKASHARDDVLAAENIRQSGLDRQAAALNTQSQDRFQNFGAQREARGKSLGDYFAAPLDAGAITTAAPELPSTQNGIVTREIAKKSGEAKAYAANQATQLGGLRSFGDLLGETSIGQARDAGQIAQIGGFKRGSADVLPLELDGASQKGAGLRTLGDILGGAGSIATSAGLTRGATVAAPAASAAVRPRRNPVYLGAT